MSSNLALEPTPYSVRCASASRRGSPRALGLSSEENFGVLIGQKNVVGLVLLHCFFLDGYEAITHITHEFDEQLYTLLSGKW